MIQNETIAIVIRLLQVRLIGSQKFDVDYKVDAVQYNQVICYAKYRTIDFAD